VAAKKVPDKKTKTRAAKPARASGTKAERVVAASAPAADAEIAAASALAPPEAAPQAADASAQQQAQQQQQTTISTSRGFIDFLVTNRLSLALTSYQTGQLMLIGPLLDNRLSVFQRNFVRAMGLWASPQRLFLSSIAQIWRLENVLGAGQLATQQQTTMSGSMSRAPRTPPATSMPTRSASMPTKISSSSTRNIRAWRRPIPCTASGRSGSRPSSPSSRRRTAAT
jgi:hypothetical protein